MVKYGISEKAKRYKNRQHIWDSRSSKKEISIGFSSRYYLGKRTCDNTTSTQEKISR